MNSVFCVPAEFGTCTKHFVADGGIPPEFQDRLVLKPGLVRA
jgi:hypothetical protein